MKLDLRVLSYRKAIRSEIIKTNYIISWLFFLKKCKKTKFFSGSSDKYYIWCLTGKDNHKTARI